MREISFKHVYSKEDILNLNSYVYYHAKSLKVLLTVVTSTFLYFLFLSILAGDYNYVFFLIYLFLYFFILYLNPLIIKNRVIKAFDRNEYMKTEYVYIVTDNSIKQLADDYKVEYNFEQFVKVVEQKEYFYLFISMQQAMIIPKKSLNENYDDFKQILIDKIPSNKRKLTK